MSRLECVLEAWKRGRAGSLSVRLFLPWVCEEGGKHSSPYVPRTAGRPSVAPKHTRLFFPAVEVKGQVSFSLISPLFSRFVVSDTKTEATFSPRSPTCATRTRRRTSPTCPTTTWSPLRPTSWSDLRWRLRI